MRRQQNVADEDEEPPKEITKNNKGKNRKYTFMKTVKSLEELDKLRFKNFCHDKKRSNTFMSAILPCSRKHSGKVCDFHLLAMRPNLESGKIHLYAHSQHTHPIKSEDKRALTRREKKLMPDTNPPNTFGTSDNIEFKFLQTFPDHYKLRQFRIENKCRLPNREVGWRLRFWCNQRYKKNKCPLMFLALKTIKGRYHVYKRGEHNHSIRKKKQEQQNANQPAEAEQMDKEKEEEKAEKVNDDDEESNDEDEQIDSEDEDEEAEEESEEEVGEEYSEVDNNEEQEEEDSDQQQKEPPRKITKNMKGQLKKYDFLKTVQSLEELDKLRFKNNCYFCGRKRFYTSKSQSLPCTMKTCGKGCKFHLLAVRPDLESCSTIHVYAHFHHNHPIKSEMERSVYRKRKDLVPDSSPPKIFHTKDNMEWSFLQTFPDYESMNKFQSINGCQLQLDRKKFWRLRLCCGRKHYHKSCEFMLLALKTTNQGYHVYKNGEHNHPIRKKRGQLSAKEQLEEANEQFEKEKEEDDDQDNEIVEEEEEDVNDEPHPNKKKRSNFHTFSEIASFCNFRKMSKLNNKSFLMQMQSSLELLPASEWQVAAYFKVLHNALHLKKKNGKICDFELMALPSKLKKGHIHVYAHSKHSDHPFLTKEQRALIKKEKKIMPAENPPKIYRTTDNIEWQFLQTFDNYEKMQQFRLQSQCKSSIEHEGWWRLRHDCNRQCSHNCPFKLLAIKNTKQGYHVYTYGEHEHNHPVNAQKIKQRPIRVKLQQKRKQMDEEEEDDEDEEDEEDDEEEEAEEAEEDDEEEEEEGAVTMEEVDEDEEEENPWANPTTETLEVKLENANEKVYKWMAGIGPNEIETKIGDWDKLSLLKMVEMADQEIREHPQKLNLWHPWLKCAIPKCLPQIEGFNLRFKDLIQMTFN